LNILNLIFHDLYLNFILGSYLTEFVKYSVTFLGWYINTSRGLYLHTITYGNVDIILCANGIRGPDRDVQDPARLTVRVY